MPLKFWDEPFLTATFLINRLPTPVLHHMSPIKKKLSLSLLTLLYAHLVVRIGQICVHIILTSLPFDRNSALFLAIAHIIRGTNVLTYPLAVFIFLMMLFLMRLFSLFPRFIPMPVPVFAQKSRSFLHPWLILR
jgi:hypothetical protein